MSAAAATETVRPIVEIEGLVKQYGSVKAVDGLSMTVPSGSIYGFVGPNGAGKTTTMRILATLITADSGLCTVCGVPVDRNQARIRARIGYMPDYFGVYDNLTVREYLEFYAETYGLAAKSRRATIADLLELVDLGPKRDAYVEALSRGMKQRLGLARCLVHDPELLILDEPASGMDPRSRLEMREIVRELRRMGKTVLLSSHILPELASMCTHLGVLQRGRLVCQGDVESVMRSVRRGGTFELRALTPRDEVVATLTALIEAAIDDAAEDDQPEGVSHVVFHANADLEMQHRMLQSLIESGIAVVSFAERHDNLEDVFMQITELEET